MNLFGRREEEPADVLDRELITLEPGGDKLTVRHMTEGTFIVGGTGSGKTSGSLATITRAFLEAGFGGLFLTTKPGDFKEYRSWAEETGRLEDVIEFSPAEKWKFDFLDYEVQREGEGAGLTVNLVRLFETVLEVTGAQTGKSSNEGDSYWKFAQQQLLSNLVDLALLSKGVVTLPLLYELLISAPPVPEAHSSDEWSAWRAGSLLYQSIGEAQEKIEAGELTPLQTRDFHMVARYFTAEWPNLNERTRSIIENLFSSMATGLLKGYVSELFCSGETNVTPDMTFDEGKIIIVSLPVKEWGTLGLMASAIWKLAWQKAIERRNVEHSPTPAFLIVDEVQLHLNSQDQLFQTTARSSRACVIYATQSYSNLIAALGGGEKAKAEADSLLGNLNLKIFHANSDAVTNMWASNLIGKVWSWRVSAGYSEQRGSRSESANVQENLAFLVEPAQFGVLRRGSPENNLEVDGIIHQAGRVFSNEQTYLEAVFKQRKTPLNTSDIPLPCLMQS